MTEQISIKLLNQIRKDAGEFDHIPTEQTDQNQSQIESLKDYMEGKPFHQRFAIRYKSSE